jgi:hypothetical protein
MPSPSGSRETSPTRRDTREHRDNSTEQRPQTGIRDFDRHARQFAEQRQQQIQNNVSWIRREKIIITVALVAGAISVYEAREILGVGTLQELLPVAYRAASSAGSAAIIASAAREAVYTAREALQNTRSRNDNRPLPPRTRAEVEAILETPAWQSQKVQDSLAQLGQKIPGTQAWDNQAADVLYEYEDQMQKLEETEVIKKLDTVSDMLKPEGSIYAQRQREIEKQRR